jgi:hypothetical protein
MSNIPNILFPTKNNLDTTIDLFCSRVEQVDNLKLSAYVESVNKLIDSLIDICIKNKINYFINQHISFTSIKYNFKTQLEKMLMIIAKKIFVYLEEHIDLIQITDLNEWDNLIEILSQEPKTKNKVSFNPNAVEYQYDETHKNKKVTKKTKPVKILMDLDSEDQKLNSQTKIGIYIKIIFSSKKSKRFINDLKKILYNMCIVVYDPDIDYDVLNPYNN